MIIIISGDDIPAQRNYIKFLRKDYKNDDVFEFENEKIDINEIESLSASYGMFGNKKLILLLPRKLEQINFSEVFLESISTNKDVCIVFDTKALSKVSKAYKLLKKYAEEKKFSRPRDYSNFNLSDAIYIEKNLIKSTKLISQIDDIESEYYGILGILQMGLRNFVGYKTNSDFFNKLHPFVKQKTMKSKIDEKEIPGLYQKLYEMDYKAKTSSVNKKNLLQDYVIYFLC